MKQISLIIILSLSVFNMTFAADANKSMDLQKAEIAYQDMKYSIAAEYFEKYIKDSVSTDATILSNLAECYWQMRNPGEALRVYKLIYPNGKGNADLSIQRRIAELYARNNEYNKAAEWLAGVPGYESKADIYRQKQKIEALKKDSVSWNLFALNLNTDYREFAPCLNNDMLYFSSNKLPLGKTKSYGWDGDNFTRLWQIPVSEIESYSLSGEKAGTTKKTAVKRTIRLADVYENGDNKSIKDNTRIIINQPKLSNDSTPMGTLVGKLNKESFNAGTIAIDNNNHVYFSANYSKPDKDGINRIRLLEGDLTDKGITNIKELPFGNAKEYSVMHPAINAEGTILVFSSDKPYGKVGYDLYYAQRSSVDQNWGNALAFKNNINSSGNEVFPSISKKGILYYSSDVLPGLGGLDIYRIPLMAAIQGDLQPEHISYPVNSSSDDFGMTVDTAGVNGYFTSDRFNNNDNLYGFHYEAPLGLNLIGGTVLDKITMWPLEDATVFVWNKATDSVMVAKTDAEGKFLVPVTTSGDYLIKAVKKDFSNDCLSMAAEIVKVVADTIQPAPRDLVLENFQVGLTIQLDNIHYDFDKWNIRADAKPILDSLVTVLNRYPITVELSSHTDCRGTYSYNEKLSQRRAESVVDYLVQHGINTNRITAKGYGERKLLNRCSNGVQCSAAEHQANRRTEVKVTGFTVDTPKMEINPDKFADGQIISTKDLPANFFDSCK